MGALRIGLEWRRAVVSGWACAALRRRRGAWGSKGRNGVLRIEDHCKHGSWWAANGDRAEHPAITGGEGEGRVTGGRQLAALCVARRGGGRWNCAGALLWGIRTLV